MRLVEYRAACRVVAAAPAILLLAWTSGAAQGCLVGRVTDNGGKPVPRAIVGATVPSAGDRTIQVTADSSGAYRICGLDSGLARVSARGLFRNAAIFSSVPVRGGVDTFNLHLTGNTSCRGAPMIDAAVVSVAERRWTEQQIHSYEFTVGHQTVWAASRLNVTVVRDTVVAATLLSGRALATSSPSGRTDLASLAAFTPSRLFEAIRGALNDSSYAMTAEFDPVLGFPSRVSGEPRCTYDAGGTTTIESLHPIKP